MFTFVSAVTAFRKQSALSLVHSLKPILLIQRSQSERVQINKYILLHQLSHLNVYTNTKNTDRCWLFQGELNFFFGLVKLVSENEITKLWQHSIFSNQEVRFQITNEWRAHAMQNYSVMLCRSYILFFYYLAGNPQTSTSIYFCTHFRYKSVVKK
jgi:hypothetical protein